MELLNAARQACLKPNYQSPKTVFEKTWPLSGCPGQTAIGPLFASLHLRRPWSHCRCACFCCKWLGPAADKLIARDNMELAIRGSNLVSGYPVAALGKIAIGPRVDKTAIGPAFAENSLARPLILSLKSGGLATRSLLKRPLGLALIKRPLGLRLLRMAW